MQSMGSQSVGHGWAPGAGQSLESRGLGYGSGQVGWISACVFRETGHPHGRGTEGPGQSEAEQERFR